MRPWMALGLWLVVGAMPAIATAGPQPLTPNQMDKVTAGVDPLQLNVNTATQVAVPIAVAVAACGFCSDPRASALAIAENINLANLVNTNVP